MMPEPSDQHDFFLSAVKSKDIDRVNSSISNEVFDVNYRDVTHDLETPLMRLCHSDLTDEDMEAILPVMAQKTPDVNLQDAVGRTLVMHACIALRHQIVDLSLALGCETSHCDRMGRSAYHYAAESGSDWIMASLLKQSVSTDCLKVLDFKGYSPMDLARHRKAHSVLRMISQAMSSQTDAIPRPVNPKPLQPAFMRSTTLNKRPNRKEVKFDSSIEKRNNSNSSSLDTSSTSSSYAKVAPQPNYSKLGQSEDISNYNNVDDKLDDKRLSRLDDNENNNDNVRISSELSPLRSQSKHSLDDLECFTKTAPIGLPKPRPLPRLANHHSTDVTNAKDRNQTVGTDNDFKIVDDTSVDATSAVNDNKVNTLNSLSNRQTHPIAIQNNKNNIFTLRPKPAPWNRPSLHGGTEKPQNDSSSPSPTTRAAAMSQTSPEKKHNVNNKNAQRSMITLDLLSTSPTTNTPISPSSGNTTSAKQLGPVISPRRPIMNGGHALGGSLNNTLNTSRETQKPNPNSNVTNEKQTNEKINKFTKPDFNSIKANIASRSSSKTNNNNNNSDIGHKNHQLIPTRISAQGRRDLEAILSPSTTHKPLLLHRRTQNNTDSGNMVCGGYNVTTEDKGECKDNLFEEEIFLNSDDGSLRLGSKRTKVEDKDHFPRREGSRLTVRRSSLSLPDLRDMTGCLVTSRKGSPYSGVDNLEDFDMDKNCKKNYDKSVEKDDDDNDDVDCDNDYDNDNDDDDENDKAVIEGDTDESVECDLEDDKKNGFKLSNPYSIKNSNNNNLHWFKNKGNNNDKSLPSIHDKK